MILATWNVNSLKARGEHLAKWVAEAKPDVVCMQETKLADEQFPLLALQQMGFEHVAFSGTKAYNGVAIASKRPITDVHVGFRLGEPDPQPRLIRGVVDGVRIFCCYVPNGQDVNSEKFPYKLAWLDRLRAELDAGASQAEPVAVVGDFNVAMNDKDVWDPFECEGQVLYHPFEREKMRNLVAWGLTDVYRAKEPEGRAFTWWDYRMLGFPKNHGLRIDYVFASQPLFERIRGITLHRPVRKWEKPSDHIPVTVEIGE